MATKNETPPPAPAAEGAAPPKKKLGKILLIGGIAFVLLIAAAGAAFFLLAKSPAADEEDGTEATVSDEKSKKKKKDEKKDEHKPAYTPLDPFTVNLSSDAGDQYLQVALTLDMTDPASADKAKIYLAKIRNDIMLHLSGKKPTELATKEGKQLLAAELRVLVNAILAPDSAGKKGENTSGPVKEVLFTSFIIQ